MVREILSLPSSSTKLGFVMIFEKQPTNPWWSKIFSMKNWFASLIILKSHPSARADFIAAITRGCIGVRFKHFVVSSIVFPCEWSSLIILSMREFQGRVERSSLNNDVSPIWVTTQRLLSSSINILSKSKTTTICTISAAAAAATGAVVVSQPPVQKFPSGKQMEQTKKNTKHIA